MWLSYVVLLPVGSYIEFCYGAVRWYDKCGVLSDLKGSAALRINIGPTALCNRVFGAQKPSNMSPLRVRAWA